MLDVSQILLTFRKQLSLIAVRIQNFVEQERCFPVAPALQDHSTSNVTISVVILPILRLHAKFW